MNLKQDELDALRLARDATYRPGILCAQTRFHGKVNEAGLYAVGRMRDLANRGFLRWHDSIHNEDVNTVRVEYELTPAGRDAVAHMPVRHHEGEELIWA